jgi:hypothetical protein
LEHGALEADNWRLTYGEHKANTLCYAFRVDEGRKRVLWICATILAARKLAQFDKPSND